MMDKVVITKWSADESCVHVRYPDVTAIHSRNGSICHNCSVSDIVSVGMVSGLLRKKFVDSDGPDISHRFFLSGSCHEFCEMADDILYTLRDKGRLPEIRGQIEDIATEPFSFTDLEIAYLDWHIRDLLADAARSCDNPFSDSSLTIKFDARDALNGYVHQRDSRKEVG